MQALVRFSCNLSRSISIANRGWSGVVQLFGNWVASPWHGNIAVRLSTGRRNIFATSRASVMDLS